MLNVADEVLDNAGWHALVGPHAGFALGAGRARAYRDDVSVFHATADDTDAAWADLGRLAAPNGIVVLFRGDPITPPPGWAQAFQGDGHQMVLAGALAPVPPPARRRSGHRARRSRCGTSATTTRRRWSTSSR